MEVVEKLTPEKSLEMKDACIKQARLFALEDFAEHMQNYFLNDEINDIETPEEEGEEQKIVSLPQEAQKEEDLTIDLLSVDGVKPSSRSMFERLD